MMMRIDLKALNELMDLHGTAMDLLDEAIKAEHSPEEIQRRAELASFVFGYLMQALSFE